MTKINRGGNTNPTGPSDRNPAPMKRTASRAFHGRKVTWEPSKSLLRHPVALSMQPSEKSHITFKAQKGGHKLGLNFKTPRTS